jgi:hypothetical protein
LALNFSMYNPRAENGFPLYSKQLATMIIKEIIIFSNGVRLMGPKYMKHMIPKVTNGIKVFRKLILFIVLVFRFETKVNRKTRLFVFLGRLGMKLPYLGLKILVKKKMVPNLL